MTAKELYQDARSLPCWVEVDEEQHLYKQAWMYGWLDDKNIVGWKDDTGAITGFLTAPGHIAIKNGHGEFCDDSKECKTFSLVDPCRVGKMSALSETQPQFAMSNFCGCLANAAPIALPKGYSKEFGCCDSGYCHKYHIECMLWFNHGCVAPKSCRYKPKEEDKPTQ